MHEIKPYLQETFIAELGEESLFNFLDHYDIPIYLDIPEWDNKKVQEGLKTVSIKDFLSEPFYQLYNKIDISARSETNIIKVMKKVVDEQGGEYFPVIAISFPCLTENEGYWEDMRGCRVDRVELMIQESLSKGIKPSIGDEFCVEGMANEIFPGEDVIFRVKTVRQGPLFRDHPKWKGESVFWVLLEWVN